MTQRATPSPVLSVTCTSIEFDWPTHTLTLVSFEIVEIVPAIGKFGGSVTGVVEVVVTGALHTGISKSRQNNKPITLWWWWW